MKWTMKPQVIQSPNEPRRQIENRTTVSSLVHTYRHRNSARNLARQSCTLCQW